MRRWEFIGLFGATSFTRLRETTHEYFDLSGHAVEAPAYEV